MTIAVRVRKSHHAGLIVTSPGGERIEQLLEEYTRRFYADFHASAPPPGRGTRLTRLVAIDKLRIADRRLRIDGLAIRH